MTWLTWRQFRTQAVAAGGALVVIAAYLITLGTRLRDSYDDYLAQCRGDGTCADLMAQFHSDHANLVLYLNGLLMLIPFVVGMFWGAPLIARELEAGTHRLVWNQSVTRRRWLAVKLLGVVLAAVVVAGVASALLTWAASPVDQVAGDRFAGVVFGARDVAPVAHAAFAVVLGAVLGTVVRRTVPAIALTLLVLAVIQVGGPHVARPHLMPPVEVTVPMTAETIREDTRGLGNLWNQPTVKGLQIPDSWVTSTSTLRTADGGELDIDRFNDCIFPRPGASVDAAECLGELDLHVEAAYQPNDRYWAFQWLEAAIYLGLGLLLAAFGFRRLNARRVM